MQQKRFNLSPPKSPIGGLKWLRFPIGDFGNDTFYPYVEFILIHRYYNYAAH